MRSFLAVLATRESRRVVLHGVLDLLCRVWSGELTVGKNGVRFNKVWYGQYDQDLLWHQGKKVRLAYDPDDLSEVEIYEAATWRRICTAIQAKLVAYGAAVSNENMREGMRQSRRVKKAVREYKETAVAANMDPVDLAIRDHQREVQPPIKVHQPHVKVSKTKVDQAAAHKKTRAKNKLRKAVGEESLDFDFSRLHTKEDVIEKWLDE